MNPGDGRRIIVGDDDLQVVRGCVVQGGVHLAETVQVDPFMSDVAADSVDDQQIRQRDGVVIESHLLVGQNVGDVDQDFHALGLKVHEAAAVDDGQVRLAVDVRTGSIIESGSVKGPKDFFEGFLQFFEPGGDTWSVTA